MNISAKKRKPVALYAFFTGKELFNSILTRQLMRISGLATVILLTTFQVLLATSGKGQNMATEKVTVGLQHESLATGLKIIEKQTPLRFYYRRADIRSFANLNLPVGQRTVEETLNELLQNTFFSFRQIGENILLERKDQQVVYEVKGRLLDMKRQPVPFSTVEIVKADVNKSIQFTQTDTGGHFKLSVREKGEYLVKISALGMDSLSLTLTLADIKIVQLPDITMTALQNQLKLVTIVGKKPFIEQRIDRTVLNVENSILSSGRTALEVLESAPGVIVDHQNDNIKLNNKSGVMVMIDGRKSFLSAADLSNMLRNMSSEQISTIEIITNPSAKYDASGTAGIIDIKLKKNKLYGTNGAVSTTVSQTIVPYGPDNLSRQSVNFNINNRTERWNTYINVNPSLTNDYWQTNLDRNINFGNENTKFSELFTNPVLAKGVSSRVGIDFSASQKTTVGVLFEGVIFNDKINGNSQTAVTETKSGATTLSSILQNSALKTPRHNITTNFNIKHNFNEDGANFTFDATYSGYKTNKSQNFNTDYFDDLGTITNHTLQRNETETSVKILTARADLSVPLSKSLKFEGGLKSDYVRTDNDGQFNQFLAGQWQDVPNQSNHFIYTENVNAGYVNFNQKWEKWGLQVGLRAEHTNSKGNSITTNEIADRNYLSLFPSVFLSQTINEKNSIRYSYSRRIGRPNYQQLNPFEFYISAYARDQGNPFLKPEFTDSYQINYIYKNISLSIGYAHTNDYMAQLSEQNDETKIVNAVQGNLGSYNSFYTNLSFPVEICKWWGMQNQFNIYNDKYSYMPPSGILFDNEKFTYRFNIFNSFSLTNTWKAELSFDYVSPRVNGVERTTKPNYSTRVGFQKSLFEKRASLRFNVSDIFLTSQYTGVVQYQNVDLQVLNRWASRRMALSFSYNFGRQTVKSPRDRSTGAEALKNRAN